MRCATRPILCRPPRQRVSLAQPKRSHFLPARIIHTQPHPRASPSLKHIGVPEAPGKLSAAPLILLAAVALQVANDDEEDDQLELENVFDRDARDSAAPAPFRETFMRLKQAKRWVLAYADTKDPEHIVEAFVPIVLDVQERVMDVANVSVQDFADFYFYSGFFASVLTDLPVPQLPAYLERMSDALAKFPERQQAARMMLIYTALLTKEPSLVKWFVDNAAARLNREPRYAGQPERIKKQIKILMSDVEQQLNENWAIIATGHFIASRAPAMLHEIVEALDVLVQAGQGQVPIDAVEEVLVRTVDNHGVAVKTFSRMDLSNSSPEVRKTITSIVQASGLKMRPPRRKKAAEKAEDQ